MADLADPAWGEEDGAFSLPIIAALDIFFLPEPRGDVVEAPSESLGEGLTEDEGPDLTGVRGSAGLGSLLGLGALGLGGSICCLTRMGSRLGLGACLAADGGSTASPSSGLFSAIMSVFYPDLDGIKSPSSSSSDSARNSGSPAAPDMVASWIIAHWRSTICFIFRASPISIESSNTCPD